MNTSQARQARNFWISFRSLFTSPHMKCMKILNMVTCRSMTVTLVSVPDLERIHEYDTLEEPPLAALSGLPDPFVDADSSSTPTSDASSSFASVFALLPQTELDQQFWVHYKIDSPHPPATKYYFQLFADGHLVVTWAVGQRQHFRGTVRFVLGQQGTTKSLHFLGREDTTPPGSPKSISSQATIVAPPSITIKAYRVDRWKRVALPEDNNYPDNPFDCGNSIKYNTSFPLVIVTHIV